MNKKQIYSKQYYLKHKARFAENAKRYRYNNKKYLLEYQREYRKHNNNHINLLRKKRRRLDPSFLEYARLCNKRKRSFPQGKLRDNVSCLINKRLKRRVLNKGCKSIFEFLPYTIDDLKRHLEKQFKPGMSWKKRSAWHIDHIIPDCKFNYKSVDDKEFQKCWALNNLQPLWAEENIKKNKF